MPDMEKWSLPILNVITLAFLVVRVAFAFVEPSYSFVDDLVYAGAANHMALGENCAAVAGNACNYEHPPLAKMLIALSFDVFGRTQVIGANVGVGVNQLGGRFPQIVMASLLAPITYAVVRKMSGSWRMAFCAGMLVLVDPLLFTLSLTAGIDVAMVFFAMVALLPYVFKSRLGALNSFVLTGLALGLSLLSKETAVFIVLAIVTYNLILGDGTARARLLSSSQIILGAALVFCAGLQLYDTLLTPFPTFIGQLQAMLSYHVGAGPGQLAFLANGSSCSLYPGLCPSDRSLVPHFIYSGLPFAIVQNSACTACWAATNPLDWLTYLPPVAFPTALLLVVNYPLVWMSFVWVPVALVASLKRNVTAGARPRVLAASMLCWNIGSSLWLYSSLGRAVFEWYLLPAVPAFAIGGAYILTMPRIPTWVSYALLAALLATGLLLSPMVYHLLYPQPQYCTYC